MRILVLSDIHGNLEALNTVLTESTRENWQEIWFLGDICGYGPDSQACFLRLQDYKVLLLAGNHDLYVCGKMRGDFFNDNARKSLILGREEIKKELTDHLKRLSSQTQKKGVLLVHGSILDPEKSYIIDASDARKNISLTRKRTILYGHSHIQEYYSLKKGDLISDRGEEGMTLSLRKGKMLINPGSVGQPRDRDNRAAWGILDTKKKEFTFHRTTYDFKITQSKMRAKSYPEFLINRLELGI